MPGGIVDRIITGIDAGRRLSAAWRAVRSALPSSPWRGADADDGEVAAVDRPRGVLLTALDVVGDVHRVAEQADLRGADDAEADDRGFHSHGPVSPGRGDLERRAGDLNGKVILELAWPALRDPARVLGEPVLQGHLRLVVEELAGFRRRAVRRVHLSRPGGRNSGIQVRPADLQDQFDSSASSAMVHPSSSGPTLMTSPATSSVASFSSGPVTSLMKLRHRLCEPSPYTIGGWPDKTRLIMMPATFRYGSQYR